jgi:hypothetical protein
VEFFTDRNFGKVVPQLLSASGLAVHRHDDYFAQDEDDDVWAPIIAERGWIGLSRDRAITRTVFEYDAVMFSGGRLFVLTGGSMKADVLARHILNTVPHIEEFVARQKPPFIAMVYRPSPVENILKGSPGSIRLLLDVPTWEARRRRRFPVEKFR